jgi:hypothetical protein
MEKMADPTSESPERPISAAYSKLGPFFAAQVPKPCPHTFPPCIMPILQSVDGTNQRHVAGGLLALVDGAEPGVDLLVNHVIIR